MMLKYFVLSTALLNATVAHAEPCVGPNGNRPAIDVVDRHVTPGTTQIACTQSTMTITTPSGAQRDVKLWSSQPRR